MSEVVDPKEALRLMNEEGFVYIDVRSEIEFQQGHPVGAYNIPIMHRGDAGMVANPDFLAVVQRHFDKSSKLVVACKMGGRSKKAALTLDNAGFTSIKDQSAGFDGKRNPFGKVVLVGWKDASLPTAIQAEEGRSWTELSKEA